MQGRIVSEINLLETVFRKVVINYTSRHFDKRFINISKKAI